MIAALIDSFVFFFFSFGKINRGNRSKNFSTKLRSIIVLFHRCWWVSKEHNEGPVSRHLRKKHSPLSRHFVKFFLFRPRFRENLVFRRRNAWDFERYGKKLRVEDLTSFLRSILWYNWSHKGLTINFREIL